MTRQPPPDPVRLPWGFKDPRWSDFNSLAKTAASLGPAAVPALMLAARDGMTLMAQLCAIKALGMIPSSKAVEARRRISLLELEGDRGLVLRAVFSNPEAPFNEPWDPDLVIATLRRAEWEPMPFDEHERVAAKREAARLRTERAEKRAADHERREKERIAAEKERIAAEQEERRWQARLRALRDEDEKQDRLRALRVEAEQRADNERLQARRQRVAEAQASIAEHEARLSELRTRQRAGIESLCEHDHHRPFCPIEGCPHWGGRGSGTGGDDSWKERI